MRDIAVVLFFLAFAVAALRRPYYGALLWVIFGLMNPHRLSYGFAYSLPFAQLAVIVTVLSMAMHSREVRRPQGVSMALLVAFTLWMTVTSALSIVPGPTWTKYIDVLKVIGMTFVVATGGSYRVWGPPSSLVEGNNELAVALIMIIPLMYFLATHASEARDFYLLRRIPVRLLRWGFGIGALLCVASAIGSQSRGALLAIIAMGAMLTWRSKSRFKIASLIMVAAVVALPLLPDTWWDRMNTIKTYQEDLSALQRINAWETAINIANDRFAGAGYTTAHPEVFDRYSPRPGRQWIYVAHSIYFQVLGDHGYLGLLLFLGIGLSAYFAAGRTARMAGGHEDLAWAAGLMNMCKVSLVGFAAGGAFLSLAYWDLPYYVIVLVMATNLFVRQQLSQRANRPVPAAPSPLPLRPAAPTHRGRGAA
jgi:putative inorganic carbon (hco3(-)) transporter